VALGGRREHVFLGEEIAERRDYSEDTARVVDSEVQSVLDDAYDRAFSILGEQREGLERLAGRLIEDEELTGEQVLVLLGGNDSS
jgi:cell division protease FtsH